MANDIARKMTDHKRDEVNLLKDNFSQRVYELVHKIIHPDIHKFALDYPNYVHTSKQVELNGSGFNSETVILTKSLPSKDQSWKIYFDPGNNARFYDNLSILKINHDTNRTNQK